MAALRRPATEDEETPEQAAACILPALKYLATEARRAGLADLAQAIDSAAVEAVTAMLSDAADDCSRGPEASS